MTAGNRKLAGAGYSPQELGRLAAAQSLANRGITHRFQASQTFATEVRTYRPKSRLCTRCGVPADHPVHAVEAAVAEPSGRRVRPHAGRSVGRLPEGIRP